MAGLVRVFSIFFLVLTNNSYAAIFGFGHPIFQLGVSTNSVGEAQHIDIKGLRGNEYTVTKRSPDNILYGFGYYFTDQNKDITHFMLGINAFYFPTSSVFGTITQEGLHANLAYNYEATNAPVYAAAKAFFNTSNNIAITMDAGVGPNIMRSKNYYEISYDGETLPANTFTANTKTTLSTMAGIGLKWAGFVPSSSIECGYRFFFLGNGHLNPNNEQIITPLRTGNVTAQAIICSAII